MFNERISCKELYEKLRENKCIPIEINSTDEYLFRGYIVKEENQYKIKSIKLFDGEDFAEIFKVGSKDIEKNLDNFEKYLDNKRIDKEVYNEKEILFVGKFKNLDNSEKDKNAFISVIYSKLIDIEKEKTRYRNLIKEYKKNKKYIKINEEYEEKNLNVNKENKIVQDMEICKREDFDNLNNDFKNFIADSNKKLEKIDKQFGKLRTNQNKSDKKNNFLQKDIKKINEDLKNIKSFKEIIENTNYFKSFYEIYTYTEEGEKEIRKKEIKYSNKFIDQILNYMYKKRGLKYDEITIKQFFAAMCTDQILILSGKPGTGKTSLVENFSEATGSEYKMISVQPNWYENQDIIGFYNPIEKIYTSTPIIDFMLEAKKNSDKLYIICFDEMNLAQTEYYLSEFLSKRETTDRIIEFYSENIFKENIDQTVKILDFIIQKYAIDSKKINDISNKKLIEILDLLEEAEKSFNDIDFQTFDRFCKEKAKLKNYAMYGNSIKIPNNIRIVGTINKDESTKNISPKVIDRSIIVEVKKSDKDRVGKNFEALRLSSKCFELEKERTKDYNEIDEKIDEIKNKFKHVLDIELNGRFDKQVHDLYDSKVFSENDNNIEFLDMIILTKIIPKINIYIDSYDKNKIDDIESLFEKKYKESYEVYKDMKKYLEKNEVFTFWR